VITSPPVSLDDKATVFPAATIPESGPVIAQVCAHFIGESVLFIIVNVNLGGSVFNLLSLDFTKVQVHPANNRAVTINRIIFFIFLFYCKKAPPKRSSI